MSQYLDSILSTVAELRQYSDAVLCGYDKQLCKIDVEIAEVLNDIEREINNTYNKLR